jgi:hypothetical protein
MPVTGESYPFPKSWMAPVVSQASSGSAGIEQYPWFFNAPYSSEDEVGE